MPNVARLLSLSAVLTASSLVGLATVNAQGQSAGQSAKVTPPEHFYRLVFAVEEADGAGRVTNLRSYTTIAATGEIKVRSIRTGTKVPVHTNDKEGSVQYLDVGVNIDTSDLVEDGSKLQLSVKAYLSSVANSSDSQTATPVIRQNSWDAIVLIPVGKPAIVFSSDNLENKGKTQIEVTATRLE